MAITDTVFANLFLDLIGQARRKIAAGEIEITIEQREGATFFRQFDRVEIGAVTHEIGDLGRGIAGFLCVIALTQHDQGVAQSGETEANTALAGGFFCLLFERPMGGIQDVVQHAGGYIHYFAQCVVIKAGVGREGVAHEQGQVDRAQAAATIGRQRLFGTGVGGLDGLAVVEVVVLVHAIKEQDARLGMVIGRAHDLIPQVAGAYFAIDPQTIFALIGTVSLNVGGGHGLVREFDVAIGLNSLHERIGDTDGDIEVGQVTFVFGMDKVFNIRVVATQNAHLSATTCTGRLNRFAGTVKNAHVGNRARGT